MFEWLAATYKWDFATIGDLTFSQVQVLWFYYNVRIGKYVDIGTSFIESLFGGVSSPSPGHTKRFNHRISPMPKGGMQPIDNIELSPKVMKEAAEYMKKARKNKKEIKMPSGKVTTYREQGLIRKVVEKDK